ncbi:MAG: hypothetical protein ABSH50_26860 [Bryobacteraceae bacterium]|jgi:hypothetical protein
MMRSFATAISFLTMFVWGPANARAAGVQQRQTNWEGLSVLVGRKVRVVMPDGARIGGKVTGVEADALVVDIGKTTNRSAYPKGRFLVPRATLKAIEVEASTYRWRIVCTAAVGALGIFFGKQAADVGSWKTRTEVYTTLAVVAPVIGYLLGRAADQRTVTYVITQ